MAGSRFRLLDSIKIFSIFALLVLAALYVFFGSDKVFAASADNLVGTPYENTDQEEGYVDAGGARYNYVVVRNLLDSSKDYIYISSVEYGSNTTTSFDVPNSIRHGAGGVSLPVTGIADRVFKNNMYVYSVAIGSNMKNLGNQCFYGCVNLHTIPMTPALESIGQECFYGCESLTSIGIGAKVASIGAGAFANCKNVSSIDLVYGNNKYYVEDGILYTIDKTILVCCPAGYMKNGSYVTSVIIPNTVKTVWPQAFEGCSQIQSLILNKPMTTIGDKAFYNCSKLSSVVVAPTVTYIGEDAFAGCNSYLTLTVEKSSVGVAEDYAKAHGITVDVYCTVNFYDGTTLLKTQTVKRGEAATPPDVEGKSGYKLAWSRDYTNVQENIDVYVEWKSQYTVTFKEVSIDPYTNQEIVVRTTVEYAYYGESVALPNWEKSGYQMAVTPEDQKEINYVTKNLEIKISWVVSLTGQEIVEELPSLNDSLNQDKISYQIISYTGADNRVAVTGTTKKNAKILNIPNEITYRGVSFKVTYIRPRAFQNMRNLKKVTLGINIKNIGTRAFEGCTKLKTITINSSGIGAIGYRAFKNTNSKALVNVPNSLIKKYSRKLKDAGLATTATVY